MPNKEDFSVFEVEFAPVSKYTCQLYGFLNGKESGPPHVGIEWQKRILYTAPNGSSRGPKQSANINRFCSMIVALADIKTDENVPIDLALEVGLKEFDAKISKELACNLNPCQEEMYLLPKSLDMKTRRVVSVVGNINKPLYATGGNRPRRNTTAHGLLLWIVRRRRWGWRCHVLGRIVRFEWKSVIDIPAEFPGLGKLGSVKKTLKDYMEYEALREEVLDSWAGVAALTMGGIIGRLSIENEAMQEERYSCLIDGPSELAQKFGTPYVIGGSEYREEKMPPSALNTICGAYTAEPKPALLCGGRLMKCGKRHKGMVLGPSTTKSGSSGERERS
ncbi:hypothetical protein B0H34DRAFT_855290 [Crassisporium funariophilum]|nr:hypothetical protein B0H34DRAFT_855290 [Crassisporium funariophilum]